MTSESFKKDRAFSPTDYQETPLGPLRRDWKIFKLKELAEIETGRREKGGARKGSGVLSIGGEHISEDGRLNLDNPKFISEEFYKSLPKGKIRVGDILICKDGARTGKSAFVKEIPFGKAAVNEHVFIVRVHDQILCHSEYLGYWFQTKLAWEQIRTAFHGLIGGINRSELSNFDVNLPPVEEQKKIAEILMAVDKKIEAEKTRRQALEKLFQSLLHNLMTAKIRLAKEFIDQFKEEENSE